MKNFIRKLILLPWSFRQPLTIIPKNNRTMISDLFVWRRDSNWKTSFELLNIAYLFGRFKVSQVDIVFFDTKGNVFFEKTVDLLNGCRQILDISEVLENDCKKKVVEEFGTFSVFHRNIPNIIRELNSFVAERGYVSYYYKDSPLASYVHGNLDSIGKVDTSYISLGGSGLLKRNYNLQYQLDAGCSYDIVITNPCQKSKKITIRIISFNNERVIKSFSTTINSRAAIVHNLKDIPEPCRISIESRMVMARPIIFKENNMDVFHG